MQNNGKIYNEATASGKSPLDEEEESTDTANVGYDPVFDPDLSFYNVDPGPNRVRLGVVDQFGNFYFGVSTDPDDWEVRAFDPDNPPDMEFGVVDVINEGVPGARYNYALALEDIVRGTGKYDIIVNVWYEGELLEISPDPDGNLQGTAIDSSGSTHNVILSNEHQ